jgi:phosphatase NudJ
MVATTTEEAMRMLPTFDLRAVVCALGTEEDHIDSGWPILRECQDKFPTVFCAVLSCTADRDARIRLKCFASGAMMVTQSVDSIQEALSLVVAQWSCTGKLYPCPSCGLRLDENALHAHYPLYHGAQRAVCGTTCPLCGVVHRDRPDVHLHNCHGPVDLREPADAPFSTFAWAVCQRQDGKFLLVHEPAGLCGGAPRFWLPAGRVDRGESLAGAAVRETKEEGGVDVEIVGVLRILIQARGTIRVVFLARPTTLTPKAKDVPDFESVGAMWITADDVMDLHENDFRGTDPVEYYPAVARGELQAVPTSVPEFVEVEELIQRLTSGELHLRPQLNERLDKLERAYPHLFRHNRRRRRYTE